MPDSPTHPRSFPPLPGKIRTLALSLAATVLTLPQHPALAATPPASHPAQPPRSSPQPSRPSPASQPPSSHLPLEPHLPKDSSEALLPPLEDSPSPTAPTAPASPAAQARHIPANATEELTLLGRYQVVSRLRIVNGYPVTLAISPFQVELSSDGIRLWLKLAGSESPPSEFDVLRTDGIQQSSPDGRSSELVPGLQAIAKSTARTRQLTLSASTLQLAEFPAHSSDIIITRAEKLPDDAPLPTHRQARGKRASTPSRISPPPGITITPKCQPAATADGTPSPSPAALPAPR